MGFNWRRKRESTCKEAGKRMDQKELEIPDHFICPISLDLMKDPVTLSSGLTYDRECIEKWLEDGNFSCPVTHQVLADFDQTPNHALRKMIQDWGVENRNHGVQRIPTPRVPVSQVQICEVLFNIQASVKRLDKYECLDLVHKIKRWGNESERNRRSIIANGTTSVLAATFHAFAGASFEDNSSLLEEILCIINWMFPLDIEAQTHLGTQDSLRCMVRFLQCGDVSVKQNALIVLVELLRSGQQHVEALANIEGAIDVLFTFIKDPVGQTITKTSLKVLFYIVSSPNSPTSGEIKSALVRMGMVSLLLEIIIDSEKSVCERALGVFDRLCDCEEGREEAYGNPLTIPVLVKKLLRVSALASQFSVSTIWKLSKHEDREDKSRVLVEALQVGAFQKLLLLLQIGCDDQTKEEATEILKTMNPYKAGLDSCLDSTEFRNLKRSF